MLSCYTDKCRTSSDTAQQLADTYSLTCDIVMCDIATVSANTDSVNMLSDIAGCSQSDAAVNKVRTIHIQLIKQLIQ